MRRPAKNKCPKCSTQAGSEYVGVCGAFLANNACPMRSLPERPSHIVVRSVMLTCGELLAWRDTGKLPKRVPPIPSAKLYRYIYNGDLGGYVVYRHSSSGLSAMDNARAHKQAVFMQEDAASDYCRYRNGLIDRNGSDAISS